MMVIWHWFDSQFNSGARGLNAGGSLIMKTNFLLVVRRVTGAT